MRIIIFTLLVLAASAYAADSVKNEKYSNEGKKHIDEEKKYSLRLAWWELPTNIPDLYVLTDNKYISVSPRNLSMSPSVGLNSEGTIEILRKLIAEGKDSNGKPKESYESYASISLNKINSRELGVLLFPDKRKNAARTSVFDFSPNGFPYGSLIACNLTRTKVKCILDNESFTIAPGAFIRPKKVFSERTVAAVGISATGENGVEDVIASTKVVFNQTIRTMYFVVPGEDVNRYEVRCIIDIDSTPSKPATSN